MNTACHSTGCEKQYEFLNSVGRQISCRTNGTRDSCSYPPIRELANASGGHSWYQTLCRIPIIYI